jgi:urea transport system permease protein
MRALKASLVALVLALIFSATSVHAQSFNDTLTKFTTDNFGDSEEAVAAVTASGDKLAAPVIYALQDGRLLYDAKSKKVFIKDAASGAILDAATGATAADAPADLDTVRLNNRLRRALEAAVGSLTLLSSDPQKRLEAALAVYKSRDEKALPALDAALAKESNANIERAMLEARAAIVLLSPDAPEAARLDAVKVIQNRGDQEAMSLLSSLPADAPPAVARAATAAVGSIQSSLALWSDVQNAWYGLSLGSVLLLAAIGLAITFGVMGIINMAHGEMVMIGAYVTFVVQEIIRTRYPYLFDYSLLIAVPLAFMVAGAIGIAIERSIIRFLYGRPLETLLGTWGLSLILQQAVRTIFGPTNREVGAPSWMSGAFEVGQLNITYGRLWIIVFTLIVFVALLGMLRFTRLGLEMRAVTQNRQMAAAVGIRTARIDALTFGLGSGIAADR